MNIQFVIELSAIVGVVTAILSYVTFRKSVKLKYITKERTKWRSAIRKIVTKLELCPYDKRNQILVSLKTRINAYGIDQNKLNADAHIWKLIDKINICREEEYANLKEQLIYYLSLLLKYDWERSKSEVYGEPIKILVYTMYLFAGSLGSYGIYQCVDTSLKNLLPYLFEIDIIIFFAAIVLIMLKRVMKRDKSSSILLYDGTIIVGSALLGIGAKNSLNWNDCNRQIIMRSDIKLPQLFASWSNSL